MTAREILDLMLDDDHNYFGLRCDRDGIEAGTALENSHQWFQDWQDAWGELPDPDDYNSDPDHPYNDDIGCWDDGELNGVCTVGIMGLSEAAVEAALERINQYVWGDHQSIYLVAGDSCEGGNDIDELIIEDGTVIAKIN